MVPDEPSVGADEKPPPPFVTSVSKPAAPSNQIGTPGSVPPKSIVNVSSPDVPVTRISEISASERVTPSNVTVPSPWKTSADDVPDIVSTHGAGATGATGAGSAGAAGAGSTGVAGS